MRKIVKKECNINRFIPSKDFNVFDSKIRINKFGIHLKYSKNDASYLKNWNVESNTNIINSVSSCVNKAAVLFNDRDKNSRENNATLEKNKKKYIREIINYVKKYKTADGIIDAKTKIKIKVINHGYPYIKLSPYSTFFVDDKQWNFYTYDKIYNIDKPMSNFVQIDNMNLQSMEHDIGTIDVPVNQYCFFNVLWDDKSRNGLKISCADSMEYYASQKNQSSFFPHSPATYNYNDDGKYFERYFNSPGPKELIITISPSFRISGGNGFRFGSSRIYPFLKWTDRHNYKDLSITDIKQSYAGWSMMDVMLQSQIVNNAKDLVAKMLDVDLPNMFDESEKFRFYIPDKIIETQILDPVSIGSQDKFFSFGVNYEFI